MDTGGGGSATPHVVFVAYPLFSHTTSMIKLAKLLHNKGCRITFVNTEYYHRRFLNFCGPNSLDTTTLDFRFETIPDGLPYTDTRDTQDLATLNRAIETNFLAPFLELVATKLNNSPPVTSIISDGFLSPFTLDAGQELGVPVFLFWTISTVGFLGLYRYRDLQEKGLVPLKDKSYLTNGYLDKVIDWIPVVKDFRLRDLPSFIKTTDPDDFMFKFNLVTPQRSHRASGIIFHTFDALDADVLNALRSIFPNVYAIGPQRLLLDRITEDDCLKSIGYSTWEEEREYIEWLDSKEPNSVMYVNFGSVTVMGPQQLVEFAMGLANSNHYYLWIIRPDLVVGNSAILPPEFEAVTNNRGFIASWCLQEQVLKHPSVGGFLTHGGWNSILESITAGVPMICWHFFADQPTNCRYMCTEWEIGMEIDQNVQRDKIEKLVKELMGGEKGKKMKRRVLEWKKLAEEATSEVGSSYLNLDKLVKEL